MAKAREIPGIGPDISFRDAAASAVAVRSEEVFAFEEGVLDTSDIERVHDMRVASRRLRAVLEIFEPCFPHGDFKTVLRDVKALADALGERRDPDVHIDAMLALEAELQAVNRPGIEALVERQRQRQARGNDTLAAALEHMHECELADRLDSLCDGALELMQV